VLVVLAQCSCCEVTVVWLKLQLLPLLGVWETKMGWLPLLSAWLNQAAVCRTQEVPAAAP
jgi:hypothetical protein